MTYDRHGERTLGCHWFAPTNNATDDAFHIPTDLTGGQAGSTDAALAYSFSVMNGHAGVLIDGVLLAAPTTAGGAAVLKFFDKDGDQLFENMPSFTCASADRIPMYVPLGENGLEVRAKGGFMARTVISSGNLTPLILWRFIQ